MQDLARSKKEDIQFLVMCLQIPPGWIDPPLLNFLLTKDYAPTNSWKFCKEILA